MGGEAWSYFVPYQPDIEKAMHELQDAEFKARRFNEHVKKRYKRILDIDDLREKCAEEGTRSILDMVEVLDKPRRPDSNPLNAVLKNLKSTPPQNPQAIKKKMDDGEPLNVTDLFGAEVVGELAGMMGDVDAMIDAIASVAPLSKSDLKALYGTDKPTHNMVEENHDIFEPIGRGQGVYVIVYAGGKPSEIFFAGYSYD